MIPFLIGVGVGIVLTAGAAWALLCLATSYAEQGEEFEYE